MAPIIPPIWLYLFEMLSGLDNLLFVINIISIIFISAYAICAFKYWIEEEERPPIPKKWVCILICLILALSIIITILIPSQETMLNMAGLSVVTSDNIESGVEVVKNVFDYVLGMGENLTN